MTPEEQNATKTRLFLDLASEELDIIQGMIELEHYRVAVSRAYYAAFYAASAILALHGMEFKKHSAVISAIGRDFIGKGGITKNHHKNLTKLFHKRGKCDYDAYHSGENEKSAIKCLDYSIEWVKIAERFLEEKE